MAFYVQPHVTQFDGDAGQGSACVPASLANGVAAVTGGARKPTSGGIHHLVPKREETDPGTAGWSMADADKAMGKLSIPFDVGHGGWDGVVAAHKAGHYLVLQGDSDRFGNGTCSGVFNGDHCCGIHPKTQVVDGHEWWWIDDPVCKTGRWERVSVLKAYAEKFSSSIRYGVFPTVVPQVGAPPKPATVVLRYGGKKLAPRQVKRVKVPASRRANIRKRPDRIRASDVVGNLANGRTWVAYQVTRVGAKPPGSSSRVWYGDAAGTHWLHSSSF